MYSGSMKGSLIATTVASGFSKQALNTMRPMRPNPLIPTLIGIVDVFGNAGAKQVLLSRRVNWDALEMIVRRGGVARIMTRSHLLQFVDGQQKKREGVSEVLFNLQ